VRAAKELLGGRIEAPKAQPIRAPQVVAEESPAPEPKPIDTAPPERPRKRALTKSEEQKRAARARAKLRKLSSRQSA
jgi:hypothetical protein